MIWLADENLPRATIAHLRELGWDILWVPEQCPGLGDREVLEWAREEGRILLTFDRDFGELVFQTGLRPPPSIVYFRFIPATPTEPATILHSLLASTNALLGQFFVLDRDSVRARPLK